MIKPKNAPRSNAILELPFTPGHTAKPMTKPIITLLSQVENINNSFPEKPRRTLTPIMQKIPSTAPVKIAIKTLLFLIFLF